MLISHLLQPIAKIISISPKEVNLQNPQTAADLLNISGLFLIGFQETLYNQQYF